jgi:hypothetical protein
LVQAFLKKWWVESDFKAPNLPLSLRLKGSCCHYNSIERMCGTGSVMACVPKNGVAYEVVLSERRLVRELTENLNIKGQSYHVKELTLRMKIVLIIKLSMYVPDDEILILSVYIITSFDFPFVRLFGVR